MSRKIHRNLSPTQTPAKSGRPLFVYLFVYGVIAVMVFSLFALLLTSAGSPSY